MEKDNTLDTYINETKNWLVLNTSGVPYITCFIMDPLTRLFNDRYPDNLVVKFCGIRYTKDGKEIQFLANREQYRDSCRKLFDNRDKLEVIHKDFEVDEEKFKSFVLDVKAKGLDYLNENFDEFVSLYSMEYTSGFAVDGVLVYGEELFAAMQEKYKNNHGDLEVLTHPYGETFLTRYRIQLLRLACEVKSNRISKEDRTSRLGEIQNDFHWIKNNYRNAEKLAVEYFVTELDELLKQSPDAIVEEHEALVRSVEEHKSKCEAIKDEGAIETEDYEKLLWLGKIAWWVDRRKEYNLIANNFLHEHLEWLCKKYGWKYDDAKHLLASEIKNVIKGDTTFDDYSIEERRRECIHLMDVNGEERMLIGSDAAALWDITRPEAAKGGDLKGMAAFKGNVRGVARVIMNSNEDGGFNDGDILVTGMTRPDFLPLMKRASAFVTDEGGITCHAAIVAREMKKPCIIGTKIATQILKDGMEVEVDADSGVVKILQDG